MKSTLLLSLLFTAMLLSACTTVKTFDSTGAVIGKCRVVGFPFPIHGKCEGKADGGRSH